jgi:hypothetical protein
VPISPTVFIAWNILAFITITYLITYIQKRQRFDGPPLRLEHPIHIKDSLGMIRGKNDRGGGPQG